MAGADGGPRAGPGARPRQRPRGRPDRAPAAALRHAAAAFGSRGAPPVTLFFTADTHFGHGGALGLFRRPFPGVAAMDAVMEERWNARVGPGDEVWHLGDVALNRTADQVAALLDRLHGRKHLVAGNNDPDAVRALPHWASVSEYAELPEHGLVLCHYALRHWRNQSRGWMDLHGHSHGRLAPLTRQRDVGVDCWDFAPVALEELKRPRQSGRRG